jgi:hypothetical protein
MGSLVNLPIDKFLESFLVQSAILEWCNERYIGPSELHETTAPGNLLSYQPDQARYAKRNLARQ